jgi:hypothetical protein
VDAEQVDAEQVDAEQVDAEQVDADQVDADQQGEGQRAGQSTSRAGGSSGPDDATRARGAEKDPADWVTGGEPATGPQESYLSTLAREAGEDVPDGLSKAEASQEIDRLQEETGRGRS